MNCQMEPFSIDPRDQGGKMTLEVGQGHSYGVRGPNGIRETTQDKRVTIVGEDFWAGKETNGVVPKTRKLETLGWVSKGLVAAVNINRMIQCLVELVVGRGKGLARLGEPGHRGSFPAGNGGLAAHGVAEAWARFCYAMLQTQKVSGASGSNKLSLLDERRCQVLPPRPGDRWWVLLVHRLAVGLVKWWQHGDCGGAAMGVITCSGRNRRSCHRNGDEVTNKAEKD